MLIVHHKHRREANTNTKLNFIDCCNREEIYLQIEKLDSTFLKGRIKKVDDFKLY